MLYAFIGQDFKTTRRKANTFVEKLLSKKEGAEHFYLDPDSFSIPKLEEYISATGLFAGRYIVVLDHLFSDKEAKKHLLDHLDEVANSANIFVLLEGGLDASSKKKVKKHAEDVWEEDGKKEVSKKDFNVFSITDAFGKRDRKNLWVRYAQARDVGIPPEQIHGVLFWQLKSILLAVNHQTPESANLKPFVYKKASSFGKNYTKKELEKLSRQMLTIFHEARRGRGALDTALEQFVLEI